ncbi:TonB-dependent receptor [Paramagnetospirillum magnetotacticum MS-1]|uniref:TonB-dependent receptor n=2 Tax=Paramagnetospirillum magnetotacticum TaxID=188 RepID=A0A0C2UD52_PARME|nr:TonB-dependent receptor [Paramagnetospirillum magnetotacticum MS-1]
MIAAAASAVLPCAMAAQAEENDVDLAPVTVTATKTEKPVSEAPATVSVVTDKQIEHNNVRRIDEALTSTMGVYVKGLGDGQTSNFSNQVTMRGVPSYSRTGVMIDGVSMTDGFSQGANMSVVPIDNIQQIEVVPGPFSSLYGGSAMGGVVNIITKAPTKREVIGRLGYGSNDHHLESGTYRDLWTLGGAKLGIVANLDHEASGGYVNEYVNKSAAGAGGTNVTGWAATTSNTGAAQYTIGDKGRRGWNKDNAGLKLFLDFDDDSKLTLEGSYHNSFTIFDRSNYYLTDAAGNHYPSGLATNNLTLGGAGANVQTKAGDFVAGPNGEEVQRYRIGYETKIWSDVTTKITVNHQRNNYWYVTPDTTTSNDYLGGGKYSDIPTTKLDVDSNIGMPIGTQHYLISGIAWNRNELYKQDYLMGSWREVGTLGRVVNIMRGATTTKAAYAQDEYSPIPPLTLTAGFRYDIWSTNGATSGSAYTQSGTTYTAYNKGYRERTKGALSPKLAAVYKFDTGTVLRAAWGRAFRTPNLSDLYSTTQTSSSTTNANPDLKPEKARSWEIGAEQAFDTGTTLRGTYFNTQITDMIYSYSTGSSPSVTNRVNAGSVHIQGYEGEIRQKFLGRFTAFANLIYQDAYVVNNPSVPSSVGHRVTYMPDQIWNIGLDGEYKGAFGSFNIQHVAKQFGTNNSADTAKNVFGAYDPYTIANLKLGFNITENYQASLAVNNITDKQYFSYYAASGRTFFGSLRAQF